MLEVNNQDLKIDISEKVSFEQLKLMMTSMQDASRGRDMTPEEKAAMFD